MIKSYEKIRFFAVGKKTEMFSQSAITVTIVPQNERHYTLNGDMIEIKDIYELTSCSQGVSSKRAYRYLLHLASENLKGHYPNAVIKNKGIMV